MFLRAIGSKLNRQPATLSLAREMIVQRCIIPSDVPSLCDGFELADRAFGDLVRAFLVGLIAVKDAAAERSGFSGRASALLVLPGAGEAAVQRSNRRRTGGDKIADFQSRDEKNMPKFRESAAAAT